MSIDLTGITNKNEYYTNHYFSTVFEENASATISGWNAVARENEGVHTPWSLLRQNARQFYMAHDKFVRSSTNLQTLANIKVLADKYLVSLGYPIAKPEMVKVDDTLDVPVYLEMTKSNGAPLLWVVLSASQEADAGIMESFAFHAQDVEDDAAGPIYKGIFSEMANEELVTKILFGSAEPPRFVMLIGMNQITLIDRNKWNEKRYLQFELEEIFSRLENTTLQAMSVLLHRESLCPDNGKILLDELDEQSQKNASGVSQDLKYALRESIELLGNEVLYDMAHRLGRDLETNPVDAGQLTLECLRYMYRMLFVLFIESRPELGYAPIKAQSYYSGYSLESLRDIADNIRDDVDEVGGGYYLHETLAKLYELIYDGYPKTEEELKAATGSDSLHDMFLIAPLKAHIFDPEYTQMITAAKLRNSCMLRIIDLMSLTRATGKKNSRRGRISYANLGINQMGAVYEALLSYRGFIAEQDLYEVKRAGDSFNELDVGYFVSESELDQYTEDERVRYETGEMKGKLRMYKKGTFIYRLAGREREKSASYYTPEVLTKCLVKYALKELLEGKTADEILQLTICEPAMGSAAFLNEAINQLAEAYISRKEKETGEMISYEKRFNELQKVKMFIADRNVYGIDLNPVAVELAEVSLWLNTIYEGGFVPWFGTQLVNGNSLIGARRQVYRIENVQATSKGLRWYEMEPERVPLGTKRMPRKQIYHILLGDPGMCSYSDKVIKSLEPENIKKMSAWNKKFTAPVNDDDVVTLLRLSEAIDELWEAQINLRKEVGTKTQDNLSIFGHQDDAVDSQTTIRQKDKIFSELYKSEHMKNAGPYARLKFAMDYWCALWFWPIDQAELLPSRSEFLFDMSLILEGTLASVNVTGSVKEGQMSLFPTEMEQIALDIIGTYGQDSVVDIPRLRRENPRLDLAAKIAEQNKFMHWELEFADLFAERGGFDLIVGNPPWILLGWKDANILCEYNPVMAIKSLSKHEISLKRDNMLATENIRKEYVTEYLNIAGTQNFLGAYQNYGVLTGGSINLYKNFLPQSWLFGKKNGVMAFIHQENIFDDAKAGEFRKIVYSKLRAHYHFVNEKRLFAEVDHHTVFSLNIYSNKPTTGFDCVFNLYSPETIEQCYEKASNPLYGTKNDENEWNTLGNKERLLHITKKELALFAQLFDGCDDPYKARLAVIHAQPILDSLKVFAEVKQISVEVYSTLLWTETSAQDEGLIEKSIHFPENPADCVLLGANIFNFNPLFKVARSNASKNSDYDLVDLTQLSNRYLQRCTYRVKASYDEYSRKLPQLPWGGEYTSQYRIFARKMVDPSGERTMVSCIVPPEVTHTDGIRGIAIQDERMLCLFAGLMGSVPYDFFVKTLHKENFTADTLNALPKISTKYDDEIICRSLRLNALTAYYEPLWSRVFNPNFVVIEWSRKDGRLRNSSYESLTDKWSADVPLITDFERRQAIVEIDVLTAMALGMTLDQLIDAYRITFSVMRKYENDTWYDSNGRIVFSSKNMGDLTYKRPEWENLVKDAPAGKKFYRIITDDTMPGGPVERTIEYVAPFDRCDREKDYEIAWKFFEEKYKEK